MNAQDLKNSILQRAIEGKLVPQRKEEGTAKDLLVKIRAEKAQLIKEKKIKKTKPLPAITDDEKPFDIPDGWEWVRLDDIVYNHGQKKPNNIFCYIDIGLIDNQKHQLTNDEKVILPESAPSRARKIVKDGDILYATVRPYLHNMCIMNKKFSYEAIASTGFAVMTTYSGVFNKYLFFCLLSPEFDKYANSNKNSKGVAYPAINDTALYKACIPLPPLAEQHRIVAKLEELQPDIDAYDKAQTELRTIEQRFPDAMKKSLLQYAIEGKLVPQRKEEGTAKELLAEIRAEKARLVKEKKIKKSKPLPEITDAEKPFDIPDSWEWVRFEDVFEIARGGSPRPIKQFLTESDDGINWIKIGDTDIGGKYILCSKEKIIPEGLSKTRLVESGDLLLTNSMSYGRPYILKTSGAIHDGWLVLSPYLKQTDKEFFYYVISSAYVHNEFARTVSGGVVKNQHFTTFEA